MTFSEARAKARAVVHRTQVLRSRRLARRAEQWPITGAVLVGLCRRHPGANGLVPVGKGDIHSLTGGCGEPRGWWEPEPLLFRNRQAGVAQPSSHVGPWSRALTRGEARLLGRSIRPCRSPARSPPSRGRRRGPRDRGPRISGGAKPGEALPISTRFRLVSRLCKFRHGV